MSTPPAQRRGTKSPEARRAEILDAALRLFHDAGYDATTVQHIAAAAGVAAGTVYLYFPSKEHVLLALHTEFHRGVEADMQAAFDDVWERFEGVELSNREALNTMIGALVDAVVSYIRRDLAKSAVMSRFIPRVHVHAAAEDDKTASYIAAAIEFGIAEGRVQVSDPEMAGLLIASALGRPLIEMVVEGDQGDVDRLAAQAKEFFVKALEPQS